jgi:Na+(H+)/acetate symporter ActP
MMTYLFDGRESFCNSRDPVELRSMAIGLALVLARPFGSGAGADAAIGFVVRLAFSLAAALRWPCGQVGVGMNRTSTRGLVLGGGGLGWCRLCF